MICFLALQARLRQLESQTISNLFRLIPTIFWHKWLDLIDVESARDEIRSHTSNVFGAGPSYQQHDQELSRYREEAWKGKEDFKHSICFSMSLRADDFSDEYQQRTRHNQIGQWINIMNNNTLLCLSSKYLYCASNNNYCEEVDWFQYLDCFICCVDVDWFLLVG